jgi:hypothetical protein
VPEIIGDIFAVALTAAYIVLYFMSLKQRDLIKSALIFFSVDAGIFYLYVLFYSLAINLTEWLEGYGIILLAAPIIFIVLLARGVAAQKSLMDVSYEEYKGYRGYAGYGGSGQGGYYGGGYRGSYRGGGFGG